jgi:preprotein translocase subunit SecA
VLDRKWREHLYEMDYLREGIGLRAYSQRDPLVEYQREGYDMFATMMDAIKEESVGYLFNLEVQVAEEPAEEEAAELSTLGAGSAVAQAAAAGKAAPNIVAKGLERPKAPQNLSYTAPDEGGEAEVTAASEAEVGDEFAGVGRNDECPCGSGKKYKKCHGAPGGPTGLTTRVNG